MAVNDIPSPDLRESNGLLQSNGMVTAVESLSGTETCALTRLADARPAGEGILLFSLDF